MVNRARICLARASLLLVVLFLIIAAQCRAAQIDFGNQTFTLINDNADGSVVLGEGLVLTGGNNGSGLPGSTDLLTTAVASGSVNFQYRFTTLDIDPVTGDVFDWAGYVVDGAFTQFSPLFSNSPVPFAFSVAAGQQYGFRVVTADNTGEPGVLTISVSATGTVPEPGSAVLIAIAVCAYAAWRRVRVARRKPALRHIILIVGFAAAIVLAATVRSQDQIFYSAVDDTGLLKLTTVTDARQTNLALRPLQSGASLANTQFPEFKQKIVWPQRTVPAPKFAATNLSTLAAPVIPTLSVTYANAGFSFLGLTHAQQRLANNGNQFSIEPPSPQIAVGNGYVLEGVNNAIAVYDASGTPLLPRVLSTNELFGVAPAINRTTGINGVYPTDMRVFYDQGLNRWFVMQRGQDNDAFGNPLNSSHLYLAVSQTGDPTQTYNIYGMDTTNSSRPGCPCFLDYPQIAADQFGVYISADLYDTVAGEFQGASIYAIAKASLAAGIESPVVQEFALPNATGFERALSPATTPPNASYFLASGGLEYFVSTNGAASIDNNFALWALTNTASLATAPSLTLIEKIIPGLQYTYPFVANQRPGPLPYGSSLQPPGQLPFIDGGSDSRILSLVYSGGRLYLTLATQELDAKGKSVVAGAYAILSPTYRAGRIAAPVLRQGKLIINNNHVLRPTVAVNPAGKGVIVFSIAGPDYYPSVGFVTIDTFSTATTARIAGVGVLPEDGFTGYDPPTAPVARWGDYSSAIATADGSIWMTAEYIAGNPVAGFANWATRVVHYLP